MKSLAGKKIVLGVTGSIAAYKAALLVRLLVKAKAEVQVVMTKAANDFITATTLSTLSKKPVVQSFYSNKDQGEWHNHVELGLWADVMLVAPATANTISDMTNGKCDNVLQAIYLSARCPVMVAPAMDLDMYLHFTTQENLAKLNANNVSIIEPEDGELASGLVGKGRMAEPEHIIDFLNDFFSADLPLAGKKMLITAGPTYEAIDPVRFIGNHSSGKMGINIAEEAVKLGAEVTLVCGPSSIKSSDSINRLNVVSAEEMYNAASSEFNSVDIAIMSAAVADYTPETKANSKIKKADQNLAVNLKPTKDILKTLGQQKQNQIVIGFALETNNEIENAKKKLTTKNADMIVLNSLQEKGAGFGHDTNSVHLVMKNNNIVSSGLMSKQKVASFILQHLISEFVA